MLEISNVTKTFHARTVNERIALNNVSLHLDDRDFVTVIGGNGAGKSTLLNAIAGVWPVESGRIVIDGTDIIHLRVHCRDTAGPETVRSAPVCRHCPARAGDHGVL